jgi:predicted permease
MRFVQKLALTLRAIFRPRAADRELDAEFAEHLASETEDLIARGIPPEEARRRARATMGSVALLQQECRDTRGTARLEQLKQDAAYAWRVLLRNPAFSVTALLTMALAIGSTTAVFSLVDGILIRPLPFADPGRLYNASDLGMKGPFEVMRANSRLADYAGYLAPRSFSIAGREFPERIKGCQVSANFFSVLGVAPLIGQTFQLSDERPGAPRSVVLSYDFWVARYGGRSDAIGQWLVLDEVDFRIAGVMPAGFRHPAPEVNFWVPVRLDPRSIGDYWGSGGVMTFARLRPGATVLAAHAELRAWIPRIRAMFPWRMPDAWALGAALTPLQEHLVVGTRTRSLLLLAVVALLLLIAMVNVANLMVGQAAAREREFTLRSWLGATPGRLARQVLTEALVLAMAGGVIGATLAYLQLAALKYLLPADTPRLAEVAIDGRVLGFTAAISLVSGLLFGLLPAWRARRARLAAGLRTGSALVTAEAAFATILLVASGLMLHSFWSLVRIDPGFRIQSVVTARLSLNHAAVVSTNVDKTLALFYQIRLKLSEYPGVTHVAAMNVLPLTPENSFFAAAIEGHPRPPQEPAFSLWCGAVTPDHLDTLGIRLLQGRRFTDADRRTSAPVVLVSRATAERFWPGVSPIGRHLKPVWNTEWRTIVGVVEDVRNFGITGPPEYIDGEVYVPLGQSIGGLAELSLVARVAGDSAAFEKRLPSMIQQVCPTCAVSKIAGMQSIVAGAVETPRSTAWLVGGFALLALGMAAAGIFGVVAHSVLRRTRELGIRLALGAERSRIAWLVIGSSLRFTVVGALAGLAVCWPLVRLVKSLLFGIPEHDLMAFVLTPIALLIVAALAAAIPARRAIRIDPARSLRV